MPSLGTLGSPRGTAGLDSHASIGSLEIRGRDIEGEGGRRGGDINGLVPPRRCSIVFEFLDEDDEDR